MSAASSPSQRNGTYSVPRRFGISAIFALTTLFAFLFAGLRAFNAPAIVYLYFGTLAVAICLAQMIFGSVPRLASILAGALLLPFWTLAISVWDGLGIDAISLAVASLPFTMAGGGFLGYLAGTVMAGFFLLLDMANLHKPPAGLPPKTENESPAVKLNEPAAPMSPQRIPRLSDAEIGECRE